MIMSKANKSIRPAKPQACGTILPTAYSLAINEAWHIRRTREAREVASKLVALKGAEMRQQGGETRYYVRHDLYAVVSLRDLRPRWFEVRADGDYAVRR